MNAKQSKRLQDDAAQVMDKCRSWCKPVLVYVNAQGQIEFTRDTSRKADKWLAGQIEAVVGVYDTRATAEEIIEDMMLVRGVA